MIDLPEKLKMDVMKAARKSRRKVITLYYCRHCQRPFNARKGKGGRTYCPKHKGLA